MILSFILPTMPRFHCREKIGKIRIKKKNEKNRKNTTVMSVVRNESVAGQSAIRVK
jgi:hypothetical protein